MSEDKKTIEVDFDIGDKVKIKANGAIGIINGVWKDVSRINYNVEWVAPTSSLMNKWFISKELERIDEP